MLEINFEEAEYPITEGTPLSVLMQFRRTQSSFNITLRPVSISSAEDCGLGDFINCAAIGEDFRATPGTKIMGVLNPMLVGLCFDYWVSKVLFGDNFAKTHFLS